MVMPSIRSGLVMMTRFKIHAAAKLELKAAQVSIEGVKVEIKGTTVSVQAAGPCNVTGLPIKLN